VCGPLRARAQQCALFPLPRSPTSPAPPTQAQRSNTARIASGQYNSLYAGSNTAQNSLSTSFFQTHNARASARVEGDSCAAVVQRLYVPSKTLSRPASAPAESQVEQEGDRMFTSGDLNGAIRKYSAAIEQRVTLLSLQKRCAAWAHLGRSQDALKDAKLVAQADPTSAKARLAVKNIEQYLKDCANCVPGYKTAHVTLLCSLTPKELRQWRAPAPSLYNQ